MGEERNPFLSFDMFSILCKNILIYLDIQYMYFDKMDVVIDTYRNKQKGWSFAYMYIIKKENRHDNMTYVV